MSTQQAPRMSALIGLVASSTALSALGIDAILPALPVIGSEMHVAVENRLQWVVSTYFLGLGLGQLVFGTLSDSVGRKRVLVSGVAGYVVLSVVAALSPNLATLLVVRALQGFAIAASGVARSIVRDLHSGAAMAKVLSIAFAVFLIVPILGPAFGQVVLYVVPWRALLLVMAAFGLLHVCLVGRYWPETLPPSKRTRPDFAQLRTVVAFVATEPQSVLCSLASTLLGGWMLAYVAMMPQIFAHVFGQPTRMPLALGACASAMAAGSLISASLVDRFGPKPIATVALVAFVAAALAHLSWIAFAAETVASFVVFQAVTLAAMGLASSNLSASALENVGQFAGTAAALQGAVLMTGSAVLSSVIGSGFAGKASWVPLSAAVCGTIATALVAILPALSRSS
jgi:DHA1 family bicyclomycin/chloramphenicol resistance-like MFS transporter